MFRRLKQSLSAWSNTINIICLPVAKKQIVFYSENGSYRNFIEPVIRHLTTRMDRSVVYVTSDQADPWLQTSPPNVTSYYVGQRETLVTFFNTLNCHVIVMTMPELGMHHIKRSKNPVHYAYLHHSIVSSHMIYQKAAFDFFDSILCVGPHHEEETRQWEAAMGLPPKQLLQHGYGPLDMLLDQRVKTVPVEDGRKRVLLAPSWGPDGILEGPGEPLISNILDAGYHLTVRPHPQTRQRSPDILDTLIKTFDGRDNFTWEENILNHDSFHSAHVMISDWSGAALEFSFALERPVLFLDVPRKVNNPDYEMIDATPLEVSIRSEIGKVVAPGDTAGLLQALKDMGENEEQYRENAQTARDKWVFNVGKSGEAGARLIAELNDACRDKVQ